MLVVARAFYIGDCAGDKRTAIASTLVNVSFFCLFLDFFFVKYDGSSPKAGSSKADSKASKAQ